MHRTFVYIVFISVCAASIYSLTKTITTLAPDFSIFYYATADFLKQKNAYTDSSLYSIFPYPPVTALFYIPFTFLPYNLAQGAFILLSYISIFIIIYFVQKILIKKFILLDYILLSTLTLLSFPIKFTLGMGQINIVAFLCIIISFYWYVKRKRTVSVLALLCGIILKPIFGFVLLFYILKKDIYFLNIFSTVLIFFLFISFIVFGFEATAYYIQYVVPHFSDVTGREVYYNQGLLGFISRLTDTILFRKIIFYTFTLGAITTLCIFSFKKKIDDIQLFSLIIVALSFLDPLAWQHHFIILIFPFLYLYYEWQRARNKMFLFLLLISYILVSSNIQNPQTFSPFPRQLALSHVFYGAIILCGVLIYSILRRSGRT